MVLEKIMKFLEHHESELTTLAVGMMAMAYKFVKYKVTNPRRIILEMMLALVICLIVIPYFTELFKWSAKFSLLVAWFAHQESSKFLDRVGIFVDSKSEI